jgi:DnaJ-class molecular chaperone
MKVDNVTPHYIPNSNSNGLPFQRRFIENSANCGGCNGSGLQGYMDYCRMCRGTGIVPWYEFSRGIHEADMIELGVFYTYCINKLKY